MTVSIEGAGSGKTEPLSFQDFENIDQIDFDQDSDSDGSTSQIQNPNAPQEPILKLLLFAGQFKDASSMTAIELPLSDLQFEPNPTSNPEAPSYQVEHMLLQQLLQPYPKSTNPRTR